LDIVLILSELSFSFDEYLLLNEWVPSNFKNFSIKALHLASKDGFSFSSLKANVEGKTQNLVIFTSENGKRFGFYTPLSLSFTNRTWLTDLSLTSFTFSIDKKMKFKLKEEDKTKCLCINDNHLMLGTGNDIHIYDNSNISNKNYCYTQSGFIAENVSFQTGSEEARKFMTEMESFKLKEIEWYQISI